MVSPASYHVDIKQNGPYGGKNTVDGNVLRIASVSTNARYNISRDDCECKAGQTGWPC